MGNRTHKSIQYAKQDIPVHKADICIHQIIKNIVKIIQWHTAAKPIQKDQNLK